MMLVSPDLRHPTLARLKELVRSRGRLGEPVVTTLDRAAATCRDVIPSFVIVVLCPGQLDQTFDVIRRLRDGFAGQLLAVGPATDPKLILRAMQVGADRFLDQAELETELDSALVRLRIGGDDAPRQGRAVALLSASGGCGASTLAANMAVLLAAEHGRCNLIDLNPGKADLAPLFDLKPQYTLLDLCRNEARLDRAMYEKLLTRHRSGVELLAAPREFGDARHVTAGGVNQAFTLAKESFAEVVADLEDCHHDEQTVALQHATEILVVTRLDFTAVRNTRRVLDHLTAAQIPRDRVKVVVNHHGLPGELPADEAEDALGEKITRFVPHDPQTIGAANNTGVPAALKFPDAAVVHGIGRLAGLEPKKKAEAGERVPRVVPMIRRMFGFT